jgi:hypothetical protein
MKKLMAGILIVAVAGALAQTTQAGDCRRSTAGWVFAGVVAGAAVVTVRQPQPVYAYTSPAVSYVPPVVYAPPRVVVVPAPAMCAPRPVVAYSAPIFVRPAPLARVHLGFGHGHHHFKERGHW